MISWKKVVLVSADILLGVYLVAAFTAFNKPADGQVCTQLTIDISDETTNGFITKDEVTQRLRKAGLAPVGKPMAKIDTRRIEETLTQSPFVQTANCYKTLDGHVCLTLTQRMPVVRIKADNGDDYYVDDNNRIMPNTHYTSNLIVATGNISRAFAQQTVAPLVKIIMESKLWSKQVEQVNVLPNQGIEIVPRVGDHIVYIGQLPWNKNEAQRGKLIGQYVNGKLDRLEKFYKYGLSQAGWDKYSYINVEYDNQIICKRRKAHEAETETETETTTETQEETSETSED